MLFLRTDTIRGKHSYISSLFLIVALTLLLGACSGTPQSNATSTTTPGTTTKQPGDYGLAALPGYQVSLFASATSSYANPDSLVVDNGHVFVDFQNTTAKDCTDKNSSTVVEYSMDGKVVKTFSVPGHSDGLRADPSTHLLWATSCEDGNPKLATIDTTSGTVTPYTIPTTPHGGGYDDLAFINGMTFIAASNPNLDKNGNNVFPAIDKVTLSGSKATFTPVLMGNATATDTSTAGANSKVTLNEVDPDSMTIDTKGNLVLINQGGNEIVRISNPGTSQQVVTRVPVGTQLDDTVWATSAQGRLLVADAGSGNIYWITATQFTPGTVFTETPSDSGVAGLVGTVDLGSGIVTGLVVGFASPTGMIFVPNA